MSPGLAVATETVAADVLKKKAVDAFSLVKREEKGCSKKSKTKKQR